MSEIVREMTREELVAFNNELRAENEKLKAELQEARLAVEHNHHNDLISRREAIDAVLELLDCPNGYSDVYDKSEIIALLEEVPSAQQNTCKYWDSESNFCALCRPSAQPEQKRGRWIETNNPNYSPFGSSKPYNAICFKCFYTSTQKFNYCPNCGARMDGGEE